MEVQLFVHDDLCDSKIVNFCLQSKIFKFKFHELSNMKLLYNQRRLIVLKENFLIGDFKKKLKRNTSFLSTNTIFFLPKKYNKINLNIDSGNKVYYPIKIIDFENDLLILFKRQKILFKDLELKNDNTLFNHKNNKQAHLTEIEFKIISLLFENNIVDKITLNRKVLNQSVLIESKSLEAHLYRLRKKLINVDSRRKINLLDNQSLKII